MMIKLRKLEMKDMQGMLEWMQDEEIMKNFRMNKASEEQVKCFIENSFESDNKHYAIVNQEDEYLGTISLKHIDEKNNHAEYAIVLRRKAMGSGVAKEATSQLLEIAFKKLKLNKVYLNVLSVNKRAISFYNKMNFKFEGEFKKHLRMNETYMDLSWYAIYREDYVNGRM